MDRRKFLAHSVLGGATLSAINSCGHQSACADEGKPPRPRRDRNQADRSVTAGEVHDYLRGFGDQWVNAQRTVDTFKAGGPDLVVKGIAVAWMSYFDSLRKALELGCNLFITHEPTYYNHLDRDESVFGFEIARKKRQFIQQSGMAIIRCHDVWDRVAEIGIRDAWARFLGLENEIETAGAAEPSKARPYCGVYQVAPLTAGELAEQIAEKVAKFGQDAVQLVGPKDKQVRRVAVGTGAATPFRHMFNDLKADIAVCSDDGFNFWRDGSMAIDMQYPVIIVNHACTEEVGMQRLAEHLTEKFPQVAIHYMAQTCMFRTIAPKTS